jgi:gamma-glutamyl hydrolase
MFLFSYHRWQKTSEGVPDEEIDHTEEGIEIAQYMANFFVGEARRNSNSFDSEAEEEAALIYNYSPVKTSGSFVQEYFFHF